MPIEVGNPTTAAITVIWDLKVAAPVTRITWTAYESFTYASPTWELQASNDAITWVNALTSVPSPSLSGQWNTYNATGITSTSYRYWRLSTSDNGSDTPSVVRIGDFRLYNGPRQYQVNEIIVSMVGYGLNVGAIGANPALIFTRTMRPTGLLSVFVTGLQKLTNINVISLTGIGSAFIAGVPSLSTQKNIAPLSLNNGAIVANPSVNGTLKINSIPTAAAVNTPSLSQNSPVTNTRRRGRILMIT